MKKNVRYLFTGAGMLAVCSVLAKLLGAMYRIPLTNVLGGEGMGLYQMVFPLYTLLLTVSSGGLPVAISRLIAVKLADGDEKGASKALWVSVIALSVVGLVGSLILGLLARPLARLQGNASAAPAYLGIAPSVFFVAVLSCYRGYFQGRENMLPSAASQLIEQAAKLIFGLYFSRLLMPRGVAYGVLGALLGVSASEVLATVALSLTYAAGAVKRKKNFAHIARRKALLEMPDDMTYFGTERKGRDMTAGRGENVRDRRAAEVSADDAYLSDRQVANKRRKRLTEDLKTAEENAEESAEEGKTVSRAADSDFGGDMTAELGLCAAAEGLQSSCKLSKTKNVSSVKDILKSIASVALPVTFGSLVLPLTQVADSVLIINILTMIGFTAEQSTAAYGLVSGTVMTLVNMPVVVIFAFSAALLPKIAKACEDRSTVAREAGFSFKLCSALGLMMFLFMFVYAKPLITLLYARGLSERQLLLSANLLKLSSFTVFYVSIVQVGTAVLQGLNQSKKPALNLLIGALVKVGLTASLLYFVGIYGAVIGSIGCYAVTAILDLAAVRKEVELRFARRKAYVPVLASAAFLVTGIISRNLLGFLSPLLLMLSSVPIAVAAYLAVIFLFRWFEVWEIKRMLPFFN